MILWHKWGEYGWGCCLRLTEFPESSLVLKLVQFVVSAPSFLHGLRFSFKREAAHFVSSSSEQLQVHLFYSGSVSFLLYLLRVKKNLFQPLIFPLDLQIKDVFDFYLE